MRNPTIKSTRKRTVRRNLIWKIPLYCLMVNEKLLQVLWRHKLHLVMESPDIKSNYHVDVLWRAEEWTHNGTFITREQVSVFLEEIAQYIFLTIWVQFLIDWIEKKCETSLLYKTLKVVEAGLMRMTLTKFDKKEFKEKFTFRNHNELQCSWPSYAELTFYVKCFFLLLHYQT